MAKRKPKGMPPESPPPVPPSPLVLRPTTKFKHDVKLHKKRNRDLSKLYAVIESLRLRQPLEHKHKDHSLIGDWRDWRECHVEPDWLLIYRCEGNELVLERTGSHSDLFD
jgi:mRNA interferase YafQ